MFQDILLSTAALTTWLFSYNLAGEAWIWTNDHGFAVRSLKPLDYECISKTFLRKTLLYQLSYFRLYLKKGFEPLTYGLKSNSVKK